MRNTVRFGAKCRHCEHFDSPEWPPETLLGSCREGGAFEPASPVAEACEHFMPSTWGWFELTREAREAEIDEREARAMMAAD